MDEKYELVESDASTEGRRAFLDGKSVADNPYRGLRGMEWSWSYYQAKTGGTTPAMTIVEHSVDIGKVAGPSPVVSTTVVRK